MGIKSISEVLKKYYIEEVIIRGKKVQVFVFTSLDSISDESLKAMLSLMPLERKIKASRYKRKRDKKLCIISYMLFILAMEKGFNIYGPYDFLFNENGKPFLKYFPELYFNISHCKIGVTCAIAKEKIGVDIQDMIPFNIRLAESICSENELRLINNSIDKDLELTKIWTIKESYFKMLGTGLIEPLGNLDICELDNFYQKINLKEKYVLSVAI
ncbi:4'-phosphopantetheinyl transferase superfamily protein [Clostridium sp. D2Q-14]|uniref:4'-phosphopantetheinyl transferase family protein n=1 Tax=Anaeromonas gelatinilytica TaxID=2683194 RepID=UPI00193BF212|nr:4'-phosphopantetheinyl transferase superfamily protein [Anaeromonas gelatinilytica]MBS4535925.1 4'-phosphopantetheinyl transferase superfamily protein [Anaeromonas gelatinilytica]